MNIFGDVDGGTVSVYGKVTRCQGVVIWRFWNAQTVIDLQVERKFI